MNSRILIIGIGSPFGDDRLGWEAAEGLRRSTSMAALPPERIEISQLDRPGTMLLAHWRRTDTVILIDAVRSGAVPGKGHRLDMDDLAGIGAPCSSHGFGILSAIELARALGDMPARLLLRGIEVDPLWTGFSLSSAVARALPSLVADIAGEMHMLAKLQQPVAANTA